MSQNPKFLAVVCRRADVQCAIDTVKVRVPMGRDGRSSQRAPDVTLVAASTMGPQHDLVFVSRRDLDSAGVGGARQVLAGIAFQPDPEPIDLADVPEGAKFAE
jgi:hypothetical protein